jgi:hypothetical protein
LLINNIKSCLYKQNMKMHDMLDNFKINMLISKNNIIKIIKNNNF